ncbi:NAD(P)H-hydrate dehydratase [Butyrivibrio sp. YAB3001]|uniref:NAD(P)H-hydrate dehydratase n=1 Tax=Butyrivibrio sp. YAB3001 TaxID=1520812 RepID=UPI0008F67057|nr:NAD(P)H-hydrate dehydratase [Butyrivibrio sp. YAB3001]SFB69436.1 NAD(P)H-hydrate epimerase [Butyrivibrio sp. YAB3001]
MRYAVNSQEMKLYDRNTSEFFGVSSEVLMERASLKVVEHICEWALEKECDRKMRALIFAGTGNNGGDGACIARLLKQKGFVVTICVVGDYAKCSDLLLNQLHILEKYGTVTDTLFNIETSRSMADHDVIVDALFGIGLSRSIAGDHAKAIDYINACKAERKSDLLVVSVDIPSGINADNGKICEKAVKADITVTFNQTKLGHILYPGCEYTGKLYVEDVGITEESFLGKNPGAYFFDEDISELLPKRKPDGNKGTNGKILIIAGSKNISGACLLAASACMRAGAGMVRVFTAIENAEAVKNVIPEAMLTTYEDFELVGEKLNMLFDWSTAAVIGPGLGTDQRAYELVKETLLHYKKNLVVDADAINLISQNGDLKKLLSDFSRYGKKLILTPHLGEFARLFGCDIRDCKEHVLEYPRDLAKKLHCTIICKDARSIVADENEKQIYINVSGNDGMATAGSGDVLAGILGAMMGYDMSSFEIACLGAYLHGLAGDKAARLKGRHSMIASDIIDGLEHILIFDVD